MKQRPCAIEIEILSGARVAIFPLPEISRHTRSAHTARGEVHKYASTEVHSTQHRAIQDIKARAHTKRRSTQVRQYTTTNYITLHYGSYGTQHTTQLHSKVVIQISGHMPSWLVVGLKKYIGINPTQRQTCKYHGSE